MPCQNELIYPKRFYQVFLHCKFLVLSEIKIFTEILKLSHTMLSFKNNGTIRVLILKMSKTHLSEKLLR